MNFNVTYDSSITSQSTAFQNNYHMAVNAALAFFQSEFTNNVTVNIEFKWGGTGSNFVAENSFTYLTFSYAQIVAALKATQHSADDIAAYTTLPANDPTGNGHSFALTAAQARALGLSTFQPQFDDVVTLGSGYAWTFDPNNRAVPGDLDAIGALEHEITEGVFGRIGSLGVANSAGGLGSGGIFTPLDMFRYSAPGVRDFTHPGNNDYFSIDGQHLLTEFNNHNQYGGDVADWYPTIQGDSFGDAYTGVAGLVTATDLRVLDILGWNLAAPTTAHRTSDFNGDGFDDVLVQNPSTGQITYANMAHGVFSGWVAEGSTPGWNVVGQGDVNHDGFADILIQNSTTAQILWGNMVNGSLSGWNPVATVPGWSVVGAGDLNGDGFADVVIQNASSQIAYANMANGAFSGWVSIGSAPGWTVDGVGDINGDGFADVVIENHSTGQVQYANMANGSFSGWASVSAAPGWNVVGVGDVNGDGFADVVIQNPSTDQFAYANMAHGAFSSWVSVAMTPGWSVTGVGDVNGDGFADMVIQNSSTGQLAYANMANGTFSGFTAIAGAAGFTVHASS